MLSKKFLKAEFIFLVIIVFLKANSYAGSKIIEQGTDFNGQLRDIMKTADGLRPENIWIKENPSFSPDARKWHEMWGDGAVSLFGGKTSEGGRKNDTYKFSEGEWTEMFPSTAPQKRSNMRVSENILFGGIDAELNCFSDTWEYDSAGEDWTEVVPSSYPSGRYEHSFAFADGKGMLFGGNPGSGYCDDTWEYDIPSSQWSYVTLSTYPSARKGASASKAAEGRIVLFGGESSQGAMAETWIYNTTGSSWTLKFPAVSPPATVNGDICYDKRNNTAVFFGGGYNSTLFNDLWVYNLKLNSWFLQYPKIPDGLPEEREMTGVAYTNSEDKFILFGGRDSLDECLGDTWSYILRSSGTYTSEVFDTGKIDTYLNYIAINTEDSVPADGEIKLQLAVSSSSLTPPSDFKGPDGTSASFYTASSTEISSGADDKRYFRYRVYLKRTIPGGTSDFYISKSEISYNHRPGPPSPVGPPFSSAGDGGIASSPLNIYWNNSADNDGDSLTYELFVSTKNNYLPLYRYRSELEELSTLSNTAVPLDHGSTYYYKIRGYDGIDYGEYSESWSVFIDTVPPLAVTYLKASRPLQNGAIKLEWTAPDTGYSYRFGYSKSLVISNETNWSSVIGQGDYVDYKPESIVSGEKDSFILTGLNEGTTYWFAVKFTDEAGNYSELSPSSYKKTNSPPEVFFTTQISGSWGTDSVADTATLVYEYFVKDPDPEDYHSYDILMAPAAGDPFDIVVATEVTQSSYSWDTRWVENADNYVVKLIASDQRGLSGSVTTSTVKISNYNEPPVINLISPSGGEIWTGLKEINWSSYDLNRTDTLYYEILISTDAGAGYVYEDRYVRDFELPYKWGTGNYPDSARVKVKVTATDDKDLTAEDISGVFEIANTNKPPAEFDLISPPEDSFIYTSTPAFNWNPATDPEGGALTYRLTVSTTPELYPLVFEVEGVTSTSKILLEDEKLEDEKIYYWRAEALDEERSAKKSNSVNRFAVDINPLEVISTFPEDGSRVVVSAAETLKIQFNKLPDPRIPLHKYIKITDNYGNYVNYKYDISTATYLLSMVPESGFPLKPSRKYTCVIGDAVKDIVSHPVTGIDEFTFINMIVSGTSTTIKYPGEASLFIGKNSLTENTSAYIYLEPVSNLLVKDADMAAVSETNTGNVSLKTMNVRAFDASGDELNNIEGDLELTFLYEDDGEGFVKEYTVDENYLSIYKLNRSGGALRAQSVGAVAGWEYINTANDSVGNSVNGLIGGPGIYSLRASARPEKMISGIVVYPNPFDPVSHGEVNIKFILTKDADITLEIYTLTGDLVYRNTESFDGTVWGKSNKFIWKGKNGVGKTAANGIYLGRLLKGKKVEEKFMIGVLK